MTETEPESTPPEPTAGEVGVHRQDMTEPVSDVGDSRNVAPQRGQTVTRSSTDTRERAEEVPDTRERAEEVRTMAKNRTTHVRESTDRTTERMREITPEPVRQAADRVTEQARRRPAVAIAIGAAALLVLRRLLRGRRRR